MATLSLPERDFLAIVRLFSRLSRYHGLMPRHLADSCVNCDVDALFQRGYLAKASIEHEHAAAVSGWMLTSKGASELNGQAA